MTDQPWMKFYPSDWRSDPALRICSLAARGLWIEMLGLMHEADPRGHLLIKGMAPTDAQLAVLVGTAPDQIPDLIGELESAAVFSRTQKGVIYSRRMTKDEKKSRTARKNGKNGGNPNLRNKTGNLFSDNQQDKAQDKTQRPEARGQRPDVKDHPMDDPKTRTQVVVRTKRKNNVPLPSDFPDTHAKESARTYWVKHGLDGRFDVEIEADAFRAHAEKNDLTYRDWNGAWRTWYVNAVKFAKQRDSQNGTAPQPSETSPAPSSDIEWEPYIIAFFETGRWARRCGPAKPCEPGCWAPDHLVDKHKPTATLFSVDERRRA